MDCTRKSVGKNLTAARLLITFLNPELYQNPLFCGTLVIFNLLATTAKNCGLNEHQVNQN